MPQKTKKVYKSLTISIPEAQHMALEQFFADQEARLAAINPHARLSRSGVLAKWVEQGMNRDLEPI